MGVSDRPKQLHELEKELESKLVELYTMQYRSVDDLPYTQEMFVIARKLQDSDKVNLGQVQIREIERWAYVHLMRMRKDTKQYPSFPNKPR